MNRNQIGLTLIPFYINFQNSKLNTLYDLLYLLNYVQSKIQLLKYYGRYKTIQCIETIHSYALSNTSYKS